MKNVSRNLNHNSTKKRLLIRKSRRLAAALTLLLFVSPLFSQVQLGDSLSLVLTEVILDDSGDDLQADSTYYNLTIRNKDVIGTTPIFFRKASADMSFGFEFFVDGLYLDEVGFYEFIYSAVLKVSANPVGEVWREGVPDTLEVEILAATPDYIVDSFSPTSAREGDEVSIFGVGLSGAIQVLIGSTSASVFDVTDSGLSFIVPTGAGSARITVVLSMDGEIVTVSSVESFTVLPPVVTRKPAKATITLKTGG